MAKPDSRRFARSKPDTKPLMPWQEPQAAAPPTNGKPKTARLPGSKTSRIRAQRSDSGEEGGEARRRRPVESIVVT